MDGHTFFVVVEGRDIGKFASHRNKYYASSIAILYTFVLRIFATYISW